MSATQQYPYIRAWGQLMGSMPFYVEDQVKRARETNAPPTAIYETRDQHGRTGEWRTFEDITLATSKMFVTRFVRDLLGAEAPEGAEA